MENKTPTNNENEKLLEALSGIKIISHEYVSQLETELADKDRQLAEAKAEIRGAIKLCGEYAINAKEGLYASLALSIGRLKHQIECELAHKKKLSDFANFGIAANENLFDQLTEARAEIERLEKGMKTVQSAFKNHKNADAAIARIKLREAKILQASCNLDAVNSERAANEMLTEELEKARAEIENLQWRVSDEQAKTKALLELNDKALEQLAEARAEIVRLKSEHEDSLRRAKDNAVSLSGTVTEYAGELLARDKLIEQMKNCYNCRFELHAAKECETCNTADCDDSYLYETSNWQPKEPEAAERGE